jgi:uncharacterized protein
MKIFCPIIIILFLSQSAYSQKSDESLTNNPPKLTEYVTDVTGTLSKTQLDYLRLKLYYLFDTSSTQIVVYMIKTLDGESIEDVSHSIATKNKIGQKEFNNGVLLLIVKNDKKLRIEVGYGLEGVLTDALSNQIIKNEITPHFKEGDFYEGINRGIDAIIKVTKGEYHLVSENRKNSGSSTSGAILMVILVFAGSIGLIGIIFWMNAKFSSKTGYISGTSSSYDSGSSSSYSSYSSSDSYSSSSSDSSFSGGGGDFGGGGASGSW